MDYACANNGLQYKIAHSKQSPYAELFSSGFLYLSTLQDSLNSKMKFALVVLIAGLLITIATAAPTSKRQSSTCTASEMNALNDLAAQFQSCRATTCGSQSGCDCCGADNRNTEAGSSQCCDYYRSGVNLRRQCEGSSSMQRQKRLFDFNVQCPITINVNIGRDGAVTSSLSTGAIGLCAVLFTGAKLFR